MNGGSTYSSRKGAKPRRKNMTENKIAKIVVDAAYHIQRRLGLLINFGAAMIKDGIFRVAYRR